VAEGQRDEGQEDGGTDRVAEPTAPADTPSVPGAEGGATVSERMTAGLQDTLDLAEWRMPTASDYAVYAAVYGVAIVIAALIVWRNPEPLAYGIWGGYIVVLSFFAALIMRSFQYRRQMLSKRFEASTLDLSEAVQEALEDAGLSSSATEGEGGAFLHPLIATYRLEGRAYVVRVEGRAYNVRKTVSVGRLPDAAALDEARRFCSAMDRRLARLRDGKVPRSLFK
jgi:hypothetical protein